MSTCIPINCEFHDLLESLATHKAPARMAYRDGTGSPAEVMTLVLGLYARAGEEFVMAEGDTPCAWIGSSQ
jgi:Rho-binding antiterminator